MDKPSINNGVKIVTGIAASTLILLYVIFSKENLDIISLLLIFTLGAFVGFIYLHKYKLVILISCLLSYYFVAHEVISDLKNLWPIELVFSFFIIFGPYYFGAYLSSKYIIGKTKNDE